MSDVFLKSLNLNLCIMKLVYLISEHLYFLHWQFVYIKTDRKISLLHITNA